MNRHPIDLERNDVAGALRWVERHFIEFGGPPPEDAMSVILMLQDDSTELEDKLEELYARHAPRPAEVVIKTSREWPTDDDPHKLNRDLAKAAERIRSGQ